MIAVERHPARVADLRERFVARPVTVVDADVRELRLPRRPFRVVANPPWALAEHVRRDLLRAERLLRADLVVPRWLAHRWAARSARIEVGVSLQAESFRPPAPTGSAVAVLTGRDRAPVTTHGRSTCSLGQAA